MWLWLENMHAFTRVCVYTSKNATKMKDCNTIEYKWVYVIPYLDNANKAQYLVAIHQKIEKVAVTLQKILWFCPM